MKRKLFHKEVVTANSCTSEMSSAKLQHVLAMLILIMLKCSFAIATESKMVKVQQNKDDLNKSEE